ncbi:MAG TPA: cupin domain-containing protein, partial [Nevskiaceae bacterium]|nr:cupin domain-containing protein [Nevskiaceae bacterium]
MNEFYTQERCWIIELSNSPADEALSIARARVERGVTTRWHRLAGVAERYLMIEGEGRVEVGNAPPRVVRAGDVVLIPAGVPQRIANIGAGELIFLALCTPRYVHSAYE